MSKASLTARMADFALGLTYDAIPAPARHEARRFLLDSLGWTVHLVKAGGDMRVGGMKPGGPWRIGIRHPRGPADSVAVPVEFALARLDTAGRSVSATGTVEPLRSVAINSQLSGSVLSVNVEEGDRVFCCRHCLEETLGTGAGHPAQVESEV